MDKLKPCPFCGSSDVNSGGDDKVVGVWCNNCGATGPNVYLTINGDFDWNTRATPSAQEAAKVLQAARSAFEAGCEQGSDEATAYEWGSGPQQTRASAWSDFMAEWNSDSAALRVLAGQ